MSVIANLSCRIFGHDWDEKFIPAVQDAAKLAGGKLYVAGGGKSKPCKRCGIWKWVG